MMGYDGHWAMNGNSFKTTWKNPADPLKKNWLNMLGWHFQVLKLRKKIFCWSVVSLQVLAVAWTRKMRAPHPNVSLWKKCPGDISTDQNGDQWKVKIHYMYYVYIYNNNNHVILGSMRFRKCWNEARWTHNDSKNCCQISMLDFKLNSKVFHAIWQVEMFEIPWILNNSMLLRICQESVRSERYSMDPRSRVTNRCTLLRT